MALEAYETLQIIRDGIKNLEFASLPAVVKTAQGLTKDVDRLTTSELAGLICKDPFATASVLEMANKGGGSDTLDTSNLEDALLKLGFKKLKSIVHKLLDMESAKEKLRWPEQIEASAEGLCSCIVAESLYKKGFFYGNSKLKMEDLYAATILRSYGRILMSSFLIDNFRTALSMMQSKGEKQAFMDVFGTTPIELTRDLLKETKISKEIVKSIKPFDPSVFDNPILKKHDEYMIIAEFSLRLTVILFDFRVTARKVDREIEKLLADFSAIIKMENKDCMDLLFPLAAEIEEIEKKYEMEVVPPYISKSIECRQAGRDLPKLKATAKKGKDSKSKPPEEILQAGFEEIEFAGKRRPLMVDKIYKSVTDLIHNGLRLNESILFAENDDGSYTPAYGVGDMFKFIAKKGAFDLDDNDIMGLCVKNNCDALVFDTLKENVKSKVPSWMSTDGINAVFILVVKLDRPFILCAMNKDGTAIQLPGAVIKALSEIKRLTYLAVDVENENYDDYKTALDLRTFNKLLKG